MGFIVMVLWKFYRVEWIWIVFVIGFIFVMLFVFYNILILNYGMVF